MKTDPQPRHHHEGEPPPESLIHHAEPTLLEQWLRRMIRKGPSFWGAVLLLGGGVVAALVIAYRVGGPSRSGVAAWNELASIGVAPPGMTPFGPDPNAGLPERLREIASAHPETDAARWARLRAASLLLGEGSAELATSRRSAGSGKIVEADELFNALYREARDEALRRLAALGRARSAEARLGLDADDTDRASVDDVLALYDAVVDEFPGTPEAEQAAALRRRLRRSDSIAFYDQLSRFDPSASLSGSSGSGLPGMDLGPGGIGGLDDLFRLAPGGGLPGGTIPGLDGLNLSPSLDLGPASGEPSAPTSDPVGLPDLPPSSDLPAPDPAPADVPPDDPGAANSPGSTPAETPRVPDDPFGSPTPSPADPAPEPADPEPPSADPPVPSSGLPDEIFSSGGPGA